MSKTMRTALFPGSFDPFTTGHADLIDRGLKLFDRIIIAIGYNEHKRGWIPVEEREKAIKDYYADEPRIDVLTYTTLTIDLAKAQHADFILRGIRNVTDYDYETQIALTNRQLAGIETLFLNASPMLSTISSSMVRELSHFGHDIKAFIPQGMHYTLPSSGK